VDRGALSAQEQRALDTWLAADRRRLGAFARARAVSAHFDRASALGTTFDPRLFRPAGPKKPLARTQVWLSVAAAAGVAGLVAVFGLYLSKNEFATRRGEIRTISLDDGSTITLNTQTEVNVDYSNSTRKIELRKGEALFNVAKDPLRPFSVLAGGTAVRVLGTSFTVRRLADERVKVLVREGAVEVTQSSGADTQPVRLAARTQALAQARTNPVVEVVPPSQIERDLAWQQGMISLDGMTLGQAAAEFARYSRVPIIIDDPAITERTVTGLFAANNPVGFARAVATSMSLKAEAGPNGVRLTR